MLKIYVAPISRPTETTLLAKGSVWEELALLLRNTDKTYLLGVLYDTLPPTFSRSESFSLTFTKKHAAQLLEVAGVSS